MSKRVLLAMSGGVDSSISAYLLIEQGYEVIGLTFINYDKQTPKDYQFIDEAKFVANQLKIKHFVIDIRKEFKKKIIDYFITEYLNGKTPNPCVICNRVIKWNLFIKTAQEIDAQYIATGHYANIKYQNNRYYIIKGKDRQKDQSYFLWNLPQEYLEKTLFPLGQLHKDGIKQLATEINLANIAQKKESYDVCFIRTGDYREFIKQYIQKHNINIKKGHFIDKNGNILGEHEGLPYYTVGQRKGLGVAAGYPLYVKSMNIKENTITLVTRQDLATKQIEVINYNLQKYEAIPKDKIFEVKIRYRDKGTNATIIQQDNKLIINFIEPVYGVAPGQSAVIYENEDIVAGGIIL